MFIDGAARNHGCTPSRSGKMERIIDLKSARGQNLLKEVQETGRFFQPNIFGIFKKQKGQRNCGIQSSGLVLNAAYIGAAKDLGSKLDQSALPYVEEKMFTFPETLKVKSQDEVFKEGGLTLKEVGNLLESHGKSVAVHHASDSSVERFRDCLREVLGCVDSSSGIIINYHMKTLGQPPSYGHHSPLAGYHPGEDRVLLLDTWWDTQECWASVEALFEAMNTIDSASGVTRGFCVLNNSGPS